MIIRGRQRIKSKNKPKPISDIEICNQLENHEDERVRNLVMFLRDVKKILIDTLNEKAELSNKLDKITKK